MNLKNIFIFSSHASTILWSNLPCLTLNNTGCRFYLALVPVRNYYLVQASSKPKIMHDSNNFLLLTTQPSAGCCKIASYLSSGSTPPELKGSQEGKQGNIS